MTDPFRSIPHGLVDPAPVHAALRASGALATVDAPAGGPVHIVTDEALARQVLADPRIVKDPAWAPASWDHGSAGLEAPAAAAPSLTTADGPAHDALRRAHVPLFTAKRMRKIAEPARAIARELLTALPGRRSVGGSRGRGADGSLASSLSDLGDGEVDLMADFTTRYPLTVLFALLDLPLALLDDAAAACRAMIDFDAQRRGRAIGALVGICAAALGDGSTGLAADLRESLPDLTDDEVAYLLFALVFAGQLTTDTALGAVLATTLDGAPGTPDELVRETLRRHPPAPFTLWRFTAEEVELAGVVLPPRTPVLVDIAGVNEHADGPDLTFGAGPHYCIGAQLARVELVAVVEVLRADFPAARLAVPFADLRLVHAGGIQQGARLTALPVRLR